MPKTFSILLVRISGVEGGQRCRQPAPGKNHIVETLRPSISVEDDQRAANPLDERAEYVDVDWDGRIHHMACDFR